MANNPLAASFRSTNKSNNIVLPGDSVIVTFSAPPQDATDVLISVREDVEFFSDQAVTDRPIGGFRGFIRKGVFTNEATLGAPLPAVPDPVSIRIALGTEGSAPRVFAHMPEPERVVSHRLKLRVGEGITGWVAEHRQPVAVSSHAFQDPRFQTFNELPEDRYEAFLSVPVLSRSKLVGVINLQRRSVRPFTERQIELAVTFADQAVIAIENARLFDEVEALTRELSEALEQQTATSEVLGVISSSLGELEPVFQAMLESATRICEAKFGVLHHYQDGAFYTVAQVGVPPAQDELLRLDEELDLADAAAPDLEIVTEQADGRKAAMGVDLALDGMNIADCGVVEISAPDIGTKGGEKGGGRHEIAGDGASSVAPSTTSISHLSSVVVTVTTTGERPWRTALDASSSYVRNRRWKSASSATVGRPASLTCSCCSKVS